MHAGSDIHFELQLNPADYGGDVRDDDYLRFLEMINGGQIHCYMQPIYDLYTGRIFGYELLARGVEPFVSPLLMFERAKEWDLTWELEYACRLAPEPRMIMKQTRSELDGLMNEYVRKSFSVDISIYKMITRPSTFLQHTLTVSQLDEFFRSQNSVSHVIITDKQDYPVGLITRQGFYSHLSGRYGYAIFERKDVDMISNRDMLIVRENIDLRMLGKLAMSRTNNGLYDPVVVVDKNNRLVGTITMKNVIARAFDTEIKFATSANPLTSLPARSHRRRRLRRDL
ncbi:MAG: CBS domain-containing protein [Spirochaetota bacterium]|nr:CBS domain-containing protein [Spirochaetota bacterium]